MSISFAAEKTLGKLAKWLRLLGFDTLYEPDISSGKFINNLEQERILLTRTQRVRDQHAARKFIFIESDHLFEQLRQVIRQLDLDPADTKPFSRCLQCNIPIVAVEKDTLGGSVPDYIWQTHDHFQMCQKCGKIYWSGTHTVKSLEKIQPLFDKSQDSSLM
ncbi:MAG: Mut7-C RNAse domain-containing protein [bacterium]